MEGIPWITPSGHNVVVHINEAPKFRYDLIELTLCYHQGEILRTEMMTDLEADRRNASMSGTVIEWRKFR